MSKPTKKAKTKRHAGMFVSHDPRSGTGGARQGAGRPPNWFKQACDQALQKYQLFDLLADGARGEKVDYIVGEGGKLRKVPARYRDRVASITELADRAHGRPTQHVDVSSDQALMELLSLVTLAVKQRVPAACPHCKHKMSSLQELAQDFITIQERLMDKAKGTVKGALPDARDDSKDD